MRLHLLHLPHPLLLSIHMRILFTRFPLESAYGGAEVQAIGLMEGLIARGHAVAFLGSCPILLKLCAEKGIPAAKLEIGPPPVTKTGAVSFLWRKKRMQALLKTAFDNFHEIDAIAMLSLSEKLLLTEYAREKKARVFWIEQDRVGRWLRKNPWLPALRKLSGKATTVVVSELSGKIYADELGFPAKHMATVPNGIDPEHLAADGIRKRPAGSALHVGTVARLTHDKGVDVLIDAIATLDNVSLDIVGSGRDEHAIKTMTERVNRKGGRVRMFPKIPEGVGAFYRSLDVFVLPSRDHDPCPLAPAEAMMLGVATVMTDACGTGNYVAAGRDAIIVKAGDVEALRQAIVKLQDPVIRHAVADAGKKCAASVFAFNAMIDSYETLFSGGTLAPT